jgi:hypothetical protein
MMLSKASLAAKKMEKDGQKTRTIVKFTLFYFIYLIKFDHHLYNMCTSRHSYLFIHVVIYVFSKHNFF